MSKEIFEPSIKEPQKNKRIKKKSLKKRIKGVYLFIKLVFVGLGSVVPVYIGKILFWFWAIFSMIYTILNIIKWD